MTPWPLPSGLQRGIPFILPEVWSPEQALAVIELLDDLRETICLRYQLELQELMREQYQPCTPFNSDRSDIDEPPF